MREHYFKKYPYLVGQIRERCCSQEFSFQILLVDEQRKLLKSANVSLVHSPLLPLCGGKTGRREMPCQDLQWEALFPGVLVMLAKHDAWHRGSARSGFNRPGKQSTAASCSAPTTHHEMGRARTVIPI